MAKDGRDAAQTLRAQIASLNCQLETGVGRPGQRTEWRRQAERLKGELERVQSTMTRPATGPGAGASWTTSGSAPTSQWGLAGGQGATTAGARVEASSMSTAQRQYKPAAMQGQALVSGAGAGAGAGAGVGVGRRQDENLSYQRGSTSMSRTPKTPEGQMLTRKDAEARAFGKQKRPQGEGQLALDSSDSDGI